MNKIRRIFHTKSSSTATKDDSLSDLEGKPGRFVVYRDKSATERPKKPLSKRATLSFTKKSPSDHSFQVNRPSNPETNVRGDSGVSQTTRSLNSVLNRNMSDNSLPTHGTEMINEVLNSGKLKPIVTERSENIGQKTDAVPDTPITTRQNEADEYIQQAIQYHETNQLEKATHYFRLAADKESPLGMFLYGIALRHGWGCKINTKLAVKYLQKAAESAVFDLHASVAANPSIARHELVLAIYELGVCFRHGWGVPKNKTTAAYYFEIAANLGDPDAQNDLGFCYVHGEGVKKDQRKAAKYYRMAAAQGAGILGNSWINKKKYDDV